MKNNPYLNQTVVRQKSGKATIGQNRRAAFAVCVSGHICAEFFPAATEIAADFAPQPTKKPTLKNDDFSSSAIICFLP